jgi:hypothetical protein
MRPSLSLFALAALAACSSGAGGGGGGNAWWGDRCAVACATPTSGPCAGQDPSACQSDCIALTDGLPLACVQCMIEHTGWTGVACRPNCASCCPCGFGPGNQLCAGGSNCSCSASDEKCSGYEIGKASGSNCAAVCGQSVDGGRTTGNGGGFLFHPDLGP